MCDHGYPTDLAQQLIAWRRIFHQYPEASNQEQQTSVRLVELLTDMGIEVKAAKGHYGICGIIRGQFPGPTVVFRADMDALPITEANDVSYRSACDGIMHACGHDGHMAIGLGVAKLFAASRKTLAGTILVLFQPAEEAAPVGGARTFIEEGFLDGASAIFALHLWPDLPCGEMATRSGPLMAASDRLTITLQGQGAHAGQPHHGVDAIIMAADVLQGLGHIMNRQLDPQEVATLSIGTIQGGERYNVIAREVVLGGTVRTLGETVRRQIPVKVEKLLQGVTAAHGGQYLLDYQVGYPVLGNWPEPTAIVIQAAEHVLGKAAVHADVKPVLAAEDFGRYLEAVPGAYFWLGCASAGREQYGLHNPLFDFDERALLLGVNILYQAGVAALEHYRDCQASQAACGKEANSLVVSR